MVTTKEITYIHVAKSRSKEDFLKHFSCLLNTPAVVDGYIVYCVLFGVIQRCMVHILREAEKYAVACHKKGETKGNDLVQYESFRKLYHEAKNMRTANEQTILELKERVRKITTFYGTPHPMTTLLNNALPYMFTFLRYPGMPPHNNPAELEIRDAIVLPKNIQHKLMTEHGMRVFAILGSIIRTCYKRRLFPGMVVAALAHDPNWDMFSGDKPPPEMQNVWRAPREKARRATRKPT